MSDQRDQASDIRSQNGRVPDFGKRARKFAVHLAAIAQTRFILAACNSRLELC